MLALLISAAEIQHRPVNENLQRTPVNPLCQAEIWLVFAINNLDRHQTFHRSFSPHVLPPEP